MKNASKWLYRKCNNCGQVYRRECCACPNCGSRWELSRLCEVKLDQEEKTVRRSVKKCWDCGRLHDEAECPDCGCTSADIIYPGSNDLPVPVVDPADLDDFDEDSEEVNSEWLEE